SSGAMSSEHTGSIVGPILAWLLPSLRPAHADLIHYVLRKSAHVMEYGILAVLWRRGFVHGERLRPRPSRWAALAVCMAVATRAEGHRRFVPGRPGTPTGVVLASTAAAAAIVFTSVGWWRVVEAATVVLLWVAAMGGVGVLALDLAAGVSGGVLWLSVPVA